MSIRLVLNGGFSLDYDQISEPHNLNKFDECKMILSFISMLVIYC